MILFSVRGWVDPGTTERPEGLCQRQIPMKLPGIEPATFRFAAQRLNQLGNRVPSSSRTTHKYEDQRQQYLVDIYI